eukprot:1640076-Rhodomonas_salina.1
MAAARSVTSSHTSSMPRRSAEDPNLLSSCELAHDVAREGSQGRGAYDEDATGDLAVRGQVFAADQHQVRALPGTKSKNR